MAAAARSGHYEPVASTVVHERASRSTSRWWKFTAVLLLGLLVLEMSLSLAWPRTVPRLAFLPRPAAQSWNDGCNDHYRHYERSGLIWESVVDSTARGCPER
jgi:hypothetical protein